MRGLIKDDHARTIPGMTPWTNSTGGEA